MSLKNLEGRVNPNAKRLDPNDHQVCKYCGKKAYWYLKFKTTDAYCCESYHGDCSAIRDKALAAERKYGKNYYKYQEEKRKKWEERVKNSGDIPDGVLKM